MMQETKLDLKRTKYLVGSIKIHGIETTDRFKEYANKERLGMLSTDDENSLNGVYKVKDI